MNGEDPVREKETTTVKTEKEVERGRLCMAGQPFLSRTVNIHPRNLVSHTRLFASKALNTSYSRGVGLNHQLSGCDIVEFPIF